MSDRAEILRDVIDALEFALQQSANFDVDEMKIFEVLIGLAIREIEEFNE